MKVYTLEDMAKETKWISQQTRSRGGSRTDEIAVGFSNSKPGSPINRVLVKIGKDIHKITKWKAGDKILMFHHPDDIYGFMLVKSDTNKGSTINFQANSTDFLRTQFSWNRPFALERKSVETVKFMHIKSSNSIVFRAE